MIQVLKRVADILDQLRIRECTLAELTAITGLKKTTQYAILSSLVEIGLVEKTAGKKYALGQKLFQLTEAGRKENRLHALAGETVGALAEEIRESAVAAIISRGERCTIATATFKQEVIVETTFLKKGSFYDTATGRILLSYLNSAALKEIVKRKGLPGNEWAGIRSYQDLERVLAGIKKERIALMSPGKGEAQFLAVPVFGPDGEACASIGVSIPSSRFKGKHRKEVINKLKIAGEDMSRELSLS